MGSMTVLNLTMPIVLALPIIVLPILDLAILRHIMNIRRSLKSPNKRSPNLKQSSSLEVRSFELINEKKIKER